VLLLKASLDMPDRQGGVLFDWLMAECAQVSLDKYNIERTYTVMI